MGLQDVFFALRLPFDSDEARELSTRIAEEIYLTRAGGLGRAGRGSTARTRRSTRPAPRRASSSSTCGASTPTQTERWDALRERIAAHGLRNSLLDRHRADRHHRLDRRLLRVHRAAGVQPVQARDAVGRVPADQPLPGARAQGAAACGPSEIRDAIKRAEGSVQGIDGAPRDVRELFRTAWELPQRALIDMAAARGAVHRPEPVAEPVPRERRPSASSRRCTCYAWKAGLKTTYYLRSRPATRIQQATVEHAAAARRSARRLLPREPRVAARPASERPRDLAEACH